MAIALRWGAFALKNYSSMRTEVNMYAATVLLLFTILGEDFRTIVLQPARSTSLIDVLAAGNPSPTMVAELRVYFEKRMILPLPISAAVDNRGENSG